MSLSALCDDSLWPNGGGFHEGNASENLHCSGRIHSRHKEKIEYCTCECHPKKRYKPKWLAMLDVPDVELY